MNKRTRKRLVSARQWLLGDNVALASYPRSGSTWLAVLVEALSGRRTGSIYDDPVFPRPCWGVVIKTHKIDGRRYSRFIHLVRNPFDAIASAFDYGRTFPQNRGYEWGAFLRSQVPVWKIHSTYWLAQAHPHATARYEDLVADPARELARLAEFLGLPCGADRVAAAVEACTLEKLRERSRAEGSDADHFFRRGQVGGDAGRYADDEVRFVSGELSELMKRFDYPAAPGGRPA